MSTFHSRPRASLRRAAHLRSPLALAIWLACAGTAAAQDATPAAAPEDLDVVEVLGSRIRRADVEGVSPVLTITRAQIDRSGLTSIGDVLQRLTSSGKAINTQVNASGNAGPPPDGGGIGAGSSQVDLRHLEAKRVLVLVDGKRWINETSASGVGGAVDLNTIPLAIVETIEVLGDGASAIYGSDAIAGVVNIVTRRDFKGTQVLGSYGQFEDGDGQTSRAEITVGGGGDGLQAVFSASFVDQRRVSSGDRTISSASPAGVTRGSPVTPQGRFVFVPTFATPPGLCPPTVDVNGDGVPDVPLCDLTSAPNAGLAGNGAVPFPAGFRRYTDDQSFNAQPDNLVLTPNRRKALFASVRKDVNDTVSLYMKSLYNRRESLNQAGANPIVLGPEAPGDTLGDKISVAANNPYNPFGVPLVAGVNMFGIARRPQEGGPRIFEQTVDTAYFNVGAEGSLQHGTHDYFWDVNYIASDSDATQVFRNTYNLRRIQVALGNPATCAQTPGCVPLNIFGGMGPNGAGTITPEMLRWIGTEVHDASEQRLRAFSANLSGDLLAMPAGDLAFAAGVEHRRYSGSFTPDAQRVAGEIFDQAGAVPTSGAFNVSEAYVEVNAPVHERFDLTVAGRYSDYSTFGGVTTGKAGFRWRPADGLLLRGNYAEGFRAPFIGELYGLSQFGASIHDPCSGHGTSGNAALIARCTAQGVPLSYQQLGSQVFVTTGGNLALQPETSKSTTAGLVYSPGWLIGGAVADKLDLELTYYRHVIDDAIQAPNAQDVLDACVASGPASPFCAGIQRQPTGSISRFDNRLSNIGRIETDGVDLGVAWALDTRAGRVDADWRTTYVHDYKATDRLGNEFARTVGVETNDGSIPEFTSNLALGWTRGDVALGWTMRYIDRLEESCSDTFDNNPTLSLTALGLCSKPNFADPSKSRDTLGSTTYHDVYVAWSRAFGWEGMQLTFGINNAFDKDPRACFSCALNGYDPSTYDVPGRFLYLQVGYKFD